MRHVALGRRMREHVALRPGQSVVPTAVAEWTCRPVAERRNAELIRLPRCACVPPVDGRAPELPVGRWFELRVLFDPSPSDGHAAVWIDGRLAFRVDGRYTAPTAFVSWAVGALAPSSSPGVRVYVDDARIERMGGPMREPIRPGPPTSRAR